MGKFLTLLMFAPWLAGIAQAAEQEASRFPFAAAQRAFKTAEAPPRSLLQGSWLMVGRTFAPARGLPEEFSPEGKMKAPPGLRGYVKLTYDLKEVEDAFGLPAFEMVFIARHWESGKVAWKDSMNVGALVASGLVFNHPASSSNCGERQECRYVAARSMLLCQHSLHDGRPECQSRAPYGEAVGFSGFVKQK